MTVQNTQKFGVRWQAPRDTALSDKLQFVACVLFTRVEHKQR